MNVDTTLQNKLQEGRMCQKKNLTACEVLHQDSEDDCKETCKHNFHAKTFQYTDDNRCICGETLFPHTLEQFVEHYTSSPQSSNRDQLTTKQYWCKADDSEIPMAVQGNNQGYNANYLSNEKLYKHLKDCKLRNTRCSCDHNVYNHWAKLTQKSSPNITRLDKIWIHFLMKYDFSKQDPNAFYPSFHKELDKICKQIADENKDAHATPESVKNALIAFHMCIDTNNALPRDGYKKHVIRNATTKDFIDSMLDKDTSIGYNVYIVSLLFTYGILIHLLLRDVWPKYQRSFKSSTLLDLFIMKPSVHASYLVYIYLAILIFAISYDPANTLDSTLALDALKEGNYTKFLLTNFFTISLLMVIVVALGIRLGGNNPILLGLILILMFLLIPAILSVYSDKKYEEIMKDMLSFRGSFAIYGLIFFYIPILLIPMTFFLKGKTLKGLTFSDVLKYTITLTLTIPLYGILVGTNFMIARANPGIELFLLILFRFMRIFYIFGLESFKDEWTIPFTRILDILSSTYYKISGDLKPKRITGLQTGVTDHDIWMS